MHLWARSLPRKPNNQVSEEPRQNKGRVLVDRKQGFLVILDVVYCYLLLFLLYINIEIG